MAKIDINFYSKKLLRNVSYKAVIPTENHDLYEIEQKDSKKFKTLYLLHGIMGDCNDWVINSRVAQLAMQYNIAVIMPSGNNSFYVDQEASGNYYGEYIGSELVQETRKLFNLSNKREDTFIGGLSMGGYGALRNGFKYNNTFGAIAALSSALIIDSAITSTEEAEMTFGKRSYFQAIFGNLENLKGSDKEVEALVQKINKKSESMPRIYLACGTEDFLIENNRKLRDFLVEEDVKHSYVERAGAHDWKFWDEYIEKVMKWLVNEE